MNKITDNLLIKKSKTINSEGRDMSGLCKFKDAELSSQCENKLIDENEQMYGIGYLNPVFDYNQQKQVKTPESSPIEVPHRSKKSSAKSEKFKGTVIDVSRTVRRRLDMSSIPDVVQTSQLQANQSDESSSESSESEANLVDEEFFLAKNSKLFSQVSSNTLKATEDKESREQRNIEISSFRVVEIKEMEIVKSIASAKDRVVLPRANVSVEQVPQVVERVEIIEDTETEPESADTDVEEKESLKKISTSQYYSASVICSKREIVPILKTEMTKPGSISNSKNGKSDFISKPSTSFIKGQNSSDKGKMTKTSKDFSTYLVLEENKNETKKKMSGTSIGMKFENDNAGRTPFPRRIGSLSSDDVIEDCESFYGSDKETDDILIFSDDTEVDVRSSSSEGENTNLDEHIHLLDKVI